MWHPLQFGPKAIHKRTMTFKRKKNKETQSLPTKLESTRHESRAPHACKRTLLFTLRKQRIMELDWRCV